MIKSTSKEKDKYSELLELVEKIMEHIEFRDYYYYKTNIKNTDEYQELRKYIKGNA